MNQSTVKLLAGRELLVWSQQEDLRADGSADELLGPLWFMVISPRQSLETLSVVMAACCSTPTPPPSVKCLHLDAYIPWWKYNPWRCWGWRAWFPLDFKFSDHNRDSTTVRDHSSPEFSLITSLKSASSIIPQGNKNVPCLQTACTFFELLALWILWGWCCLLKP